MLVDGLVRRVGSVWQLQNLGGSHAYRNDRRV
jgi:hypothetical protein